MTPREEVERLIGRLENRANTTLAFNQSEGRRGKPWRLEDDLDWQAAQALRSLLDDREAAAKALLESDVAPAWRRGIMHVVERIDLIIPQNGKPVKNVREKLQAIRDLLDEMTLFARRSRPATYQDAFDLCGEDCAKARALAQTTHAKLTGSGG